MSNSINSLSLLSDMFLKLSNKAEDLTEEEKNFLNQLGISSEEDLTIYKEKMASLNAEGTIERQALLLMCQTIIDKMLKKAGIGNEQLVGQVIIAVLNSLSENPKTQDLLDALNNAEANFTGNSKSPEQKKQAVDGIIKNFITGNMTRFQAEQELKNLGIDCDACDNANNRVLEFPFDNKKYYIECARVAADDGKGGNVVDVISPEKVEELIQKYGNDVKKYFKEIAKADDKVIAYTLDTTNWPDGVNKTLAALETYLSTPVETEQEKALSKFIEEFENSTTLETIFFDDLKQLLNNAGIPATETITNNGQKKIISFDFKGKTYKFETNIIPSWHRFDLENVVVALGDDWKKFFTHIGNDNYELDYDAIKKYFGEEIANTIKSPDDLINAFKNYQNAPVPEELKEAVEQGFNTFDEFYNFISKLKGAEIVEANVNDKNYTVEMTIKYKNREYTIVLDNAGTGSARQAAERGYLPEGYLFMDLGISDIYEGFLGNDKQILLTGSTDGSALHLTSADGIENNQSGTTLFNAVMTTVYEALHDSGSNLGNSYNWDNIIRNIWNQLADKYAGKQISYDDFVFEFMNELSNKMKNNELNELSTKEPEYVDNNKFDRADLEGVVYALGDAWQQFFTYIGDNNYKLDYDAIKKYFGEEIANTIKSPDDLVKAYKNRSVQAKTFTNPDEAKKEITKIINNNRNQLYSYYQDKGGKSDFMKYGIVQILNYLHEQISGNGPFEVNDEDIVNKAKTYIDEQFKVKSYESKTWTEFYIYSIINEHGSELEDYYKTHGGSKYTEFPYSGIILGTGILSATREQFDGKLEFSDNEVVEAAKRYLDTIIQEEIKSRAKKYTTSDEAKNAITTIINNNRNQLYSYYQSKGGKGDFMKDGIGQILNYLYGRITGDGPFEVNTEEVVQKAKEYIDNLLKPTDDNITDDDKTSILNQVKNDSISNGINGVKLTEEEAVRLFSLLKEDNDIKNFTGNKQQFTTLVNGKAKTYVEEIVAARTSQSAVGISSLDEFANSFSEEIAGSYAKTIIETILQDIIDDNFDVTMLTTLMDEYGIDITITKDNNMYRVTLKHGDVEYAIELPENLKEALEEEGFFETTGDKTLDIIKRYQKIGFGSYEVMVNILGEELVNTIDSVIDKNGRYIVRITYNGNQYEIPLYKSNEVRAELIEAGLI